MDSPVPSSDPPPWRDPSSEDTVIMATSVPPNTAVDLELLDETGEHEDTRPDLVPPHLLPTPVPPP